MKILAFILFTSPACIFAQDQSPKPVPLIPQTVPKPGLLPPQPKPPAEQPRYEWVEIAPGAMVDIEFEPHFGILYFSIKGERYQGIRFRYDVPSEHNAERATGGAAVLAELRLAEKIKLEIGTSADGKVTGLRGLVLCYSRLGPAAPRKIN